MVKKYIKDKAVELDRYINNGEDDIGKTNLHILRTVSALTFVLVMIFVLITPIFIYNWEISIHHYILSGSMLIYMLISDVMLRKKIYNKVSVAIVTICFMMTLMSIFILLDTVDCPYASQSFVVVFLVIEPILFIIPFVPMLIFQLTFTIAFMAVVVAVKEPRIIGGDCFEAIYGCTVGIIIYFVVMRLRLHDFEQRCAYKQSSEVDYLTKINNRATSRNKIDQYLCTKEEHNACAMIMLDVDKFKEVNDKLGHGKGDEVLKKVAEILKGIFRSGDIVGRFGGDEFIIFLKDINDKEILIDKCEQINKKTKDIVAGELNISCSIGICYMTRGSALQDDMFRIADGALYEAKESGRAKYIQKEYGI